MCGIFGLISFGTLSASQQKDCICATNALAHRGPNAVCYKMVNERIFLGHTRLSILDVDKRSHQPFSDSTGRFTIVYNGEVYNYLELKQELVEKGYQFRTASDTEVVLYAFIEWREACQTKFNGMWAFAIWDAKEQRAFCSRDRFGIKPLFLYQGDEGIQFASEMKAFLYTIAEGAFALNKRYLANGLRQGSLTEVQSEGLFKGVTRVLPGQCLWIEREEIRMYSWWHTLEHLPMLPNAEGPLKERFKALLVDACRLRMRSDVPIGAALSGGLDSSSIVSLLAEMDEKAKSFCAFFAHYPDSIQDEWIYAKAVITEKRISSEVCSLRVEDAIEAIDDVLFATEDGYNMPTGPYLLYKQYANKGCRISIDGHGADELFGGYIEYPLQILSPTIKHFSLMGLTRASHALHGMGISYVEQLEKLFQKSLQKLRRVGHKATPSLVGEYALYDVPQVPKNISHDPIQRGLYMDFHYMTLPAILKRFDACSMAHGVEVRSPFMDWRVVVFAHALESKWKIKNGYTKYLMRVTMKDVLPKTIHERKKKVGFTNPDAQWFAQPKGRERILDIIASQDFQESSIFDGKIIAKIVQDAYNAAQSKIVATMWPYVQTHRLQTVFLEQRYKGRLVNVCKQK